MQDQSDDEGLPDLEEVEGPDLERTDEGEEVEWEPQLEDVNSSQGIDTPRPDQILDNQGFTQEQKDFMYAFIGRMVVPSSDSYSFSEILHIDSQVPDIMDHVGEIERKI